MGPADKLERVRCGNLLETDPDVEDLRPRHRHVRRILVPRGTCPPASFLDEYLFAHKPYVLAVPEGCNEVGQVQVPSHGEVIVAVREVTIVVEVFVRRTLEGISVQGAG